jgi:uncharacterized repeat protein (TIGR01451 family)
MALWTRGKIINMRVHSIGLVLIVLGILVLSSSFTKNQAFAVSGTGVGIRKDGPEYAHLNDTVQYSISVFNLGDYWMRNTTVKDVFPNGTSKSWKVPDLAPLGQPGATFNVSGILYTIREADLLPANYSSSIINDTMGLPIVVNHAEVAGYADVQGVGLLVRAETNFPTIIQIPVVGGYSVSLKTTITSTPTITQINLLTIIATISTLVVIAQTSGLRTKRLARRIIQCRIIDENSNRTIIHKAYSCQCEIHTERTKAFRART